MGRFPPFSRTRTGDPHEGGVQGDAEDPRPQQHQTPPPYDGYPFERHLDRKEIKHAK